jgi:hypothetical protein
VKPVGSWCGLSQAAAAGTAGLERGITRGCAFRRSGRTREAAVRHPALVNEVVFWLVVLLTVLLVLFVYAGVDLLQRPLRCGLPRRAVTAFGEEGLQGGDLGVRQQAAQAVQLVHGVIPRLSSALAV